MCTDSDQEQKIHIIQNKVPKGFMITEIEREVITPFFNTDDNISDWHFDQETNRLIIKIVDDQEKEIVKVFPFREVRKDPSTNFSMEQGLNKYMDLIQSSKLNFQDEVLSQLDGRVLII